MSFAPDKNSSQNLLHDLTLDVCRQFSERASIWPKTVFRTHHHCANGTHLQEQAVGHLTIEILRALHGGAVRQQVSDVGIRGLGFVQCVNRDQQKCASNRQITRFRAATYNFLLKANRTKFNEALTGTTSACQLQASCALLLFHGRMLLNSSLGGTYFAELADGDYDS